MPVAQNNLQHKSLQWTCDCWLTLEPPPLPSTQHLPSQLGLWVRVHLPAAAQHPSTPHFPPQHLPPPQRHCPATARDPSALTKPVEYVCVCICLQLLHINRAVSQVWVQLAALVPSGLKHL